MKKNCTTAARFLCSFLFIGLTIPLFPEYPEIKKLTRRDPLFYQVQEDIEQYYRGISSSGITPPSLKFFIYRPGESDDLFSLAARLNIPYDTLVSLNRMENPGDFTAHDEIVVPNLPGIFLPADPETDLEEIMAAVLAGAEIQGTRVVIIRNTSRDTLFFFRGMRFHPVARAFFLKILFKYPLVKKVRLSSSFGSRKNPFSGHLEMHNGIDLAAPEGTGVVASREGIVLSRGYSELLGNHIILSHQGNYKTVYGHLSEFGVTLGQKVYTGMIIGKVGSTGRSTGPHLHFEIVKDGNRKNPETIMRQ